MKMLRRLGTVMIVAGFATLLWAGVVWKWQDPFTALYTTWKQHQLSSEYSRRAAAYRGVDVPASASLAAVRHAIAVDAARYRAQSKRGQAIGRIKVPRLGLNMILVNGTDHDSLTKGPGRDLRTYMPGQGELVYIAGHRTTYLAPFSHIETLRRGDWVTLEMPYGTFKYQITYHVVVPADDMSRLKTHHREVLVLQACHPRFFATHRYLAYARLVKVAPRSGGSYTVATPLLAAGA